jgi:hypothetical protein
VIGYFVREIVGWGLVALGLFFFFQSYRMLNPPRTNPPSASATDQQGQKPDYPFIFEAPAVAFMGFIIFRGGIHLLKVAVAARTSLQARREFIEAARKPRLPQVRTAIKQ